MFLVAWEKVTFDMNKTIWMSHTTTGAFCWYTLSTYPLNVVATMVFLLLGVFLRAELYEGSRQQLRDLTVVLQTRPSYTFFSFVPTPHAQGRLGSGNETTPSSSSDDGVYVCDRR